MLLERSEMLIREGLEADFAKMMADSGLPLLKALSGALTVAFGQGLENPGKFLLTIHWETMDAHTAFTKAPSFDEFLTLVRPFSRGGAMEHFEMV